LGCTTTLLVFSKRIAGAPGREKLAVAVIQWS